MAADDIACPLFVRRVTNGEIAGDRKGRNIGREFGKGGLQGVRIERGFIAMHVMAALDEEDRIIAERIGQAIALQILRAETDHDQAGAAALPFHQRVCRERRR